MTSANFNRLEAGVQYSNGTTEFCRAGGEHHRGRGLPVSQILKLADSLMFVWDYSLFLWVLAYIFTKVSVGLRAHACTCIWGPTWYKRSSALFFEEGLSSKSRVCSSRSLDDLLSPGIAPSLPSKVGATVIQQAFGSYMGLGNSVSGLLTYTLTYLAIFLTQRVSYSEHVLTFLRGEKWRLWLFFSSAALKQLCNVKSLCIPGSSPGVSGPPLF